MSSWRTVGLNYINYSNIAARVLRNSLKAEQRAAAEKRGESQIRFTKWENGKPIKGTN